MANVISKYIPEPGDRPGLPLRWISAAGLKKADIALVIADVS
jgi:hypothetical protein